MESTSLTVPTISTSFCDLEKILVPSNPPAVEIMTEVLVIAKDIRNIFILFHKYIITKDEPQARKVSR